MSESISGISKESSVFLSGSSIGVLDFALKVIKLLLYSPGTATGYIKMIIKNFYVGQRPIETVCEKH